MNARRAVLVALAIAAACRAPAPFDVPDAVWPPVAADPLKEALRRGEPADVVRLVVDRPGDAARALRMAVRCNQVAITRALLAAGVPANARDDDGETPLHLARSDAIVALLLAHGADARAVDGRGRPVTRVDAFLPRGLARRIVRGLVAAGAPLDPAAAVLYLDLDEIRGALERGAPADPCLLHLAAERGDVAIAELLLAAGAARDGACPSRFGNVDSWGENALATAVQHGNYAVAASLLAAGLRVEGGGWPDSRHGTTAGGLLQRAAGEAPVAFVAQLLDAGAAIEGTGEGDTPLAHAAGRGRLDVVQLLLARGADPRRSSGGATPLRHACAGGHAHVADVLAAAGATATLLDAVMLGRDADVRRLLAADPAALERPDERLGMRPLLWAAALGRVGVVATLLAAGADVNARSGSRPEIDLTDVWWPRGGSWGLEPDGISALGRAVERCDWRIADMLAPAGARPTAAEAELLAASPGHEATALLKCLLDRDALDDGAMLGALAGAATARLPFAVRTERFRMVLDDGGVAALHRDEARRVLRGADPALTAPFAGELQRHGWRPDLPTASRFGWLGLVRSLLAAGDFGEHDVEQACSAACAADRPAVLRELRPFAPRWSVAWTARHAAYAGATDVLLDVIGHGELTPAACGPGGLDLLVAAAGAADGGHVAFVRALLELGLDANGADEDWPPLLSACSQQDHGVIAALLGAGARANGMHGDRTALGELLRNGCDHDTLPSIRGLLAAGADPAEGVFLERLESWRDHVREADLREQLTALLAECRARAR